MSFFRVIIPNYNNAKWLTNCLNSVLNQTFTDYDLVVVDDLSTDESVDVAGELIGDRGLIIGGGHKRWNGGSRNLGMNCHDDAKYTVFLDSDDWFVDNNVLQDLHDFIVDEEYPDCVRLPYRCEYDGDKTLDVHLNDSTLDGLARSVFVACWTKCIKTELVQEFPENTLMEDVVQHIKQCDVLKNVVPFHRPFIVHNRNNLNSCTRKENQDLQHGKWQSSMYRYMADLLDMELEHDYCENVRKRKIDVCFKNIQNGVYTQSG
jgi:glycosyltransferase involved in cell wall biosynthesis